MYLTNKKGFTVFRYSLLIFITEFIIGYGDLFLIGTVMVMNPWL